MYGLVFHSLPGQCSLRKTSSLSPCHNGHANSPRRDYKLNDIMGGVIVTIPISEAP